MTFEEYQELIADTAHVPIDKIEENAAFREDLGIDSLRLVNLISVLAMNGNAGMEVFASNDDFQTVGNLYRALNRGGTPR